MITRRAHFCYDSRPKHSTGLATIKLVDNISKYMDDSKNLRTPVTLYLDLSKEFDTLDFDRIIL